MNWPMLYWFIPREFVGTAKLVVIFLFAALYLWLLSRIAKGAPPGPARRRRVGIFLALSIGVAGYFVITGQIEKRDREAQQEKAKAYRTAAWAHFKQRCESAHVTYFKNVPPQDGVFIMKPAKEPTVQQMKDQFWMGDPYDMPNTPAWEASGLLYRRATMPKGNDWGQRGGFDFVEAPHPTLEGKYLRYSMQWSGKKNVLGNDMPDHRRIRDNPAIVSERHARYGYTWDDISTPEDRHYWVAGGRLRVVELATGEIVAERVGYAIEPYFGATSSMFNQEPWRGVRVCPQIHRNSREFISTALGTWNELRDEGREK